jgi:DNA-binding MltR family transcriptional regulator
MMANPQATEGVKKLVRVFVDKGYALKASVEPVQFSANKPGGKLRVR